MQTERTVLGGRYELDRLIGKGGMADVYVASDRVLNRLVAVKILAPQFARDSSFVERFKREARAAAALNHQNLVSVFDSGSDDGTHYIVMEYVEGKTLADIIKERAPIDPGKSVSIADAVAAGIAYAHRAGIVHRDIKPGNIMLAPGGVVKVTDFGIARAQEGERLTQTATILGTAAYVSPEQAQGGEVDARSDLYSLGCVIYEMLTGRTPFTADTPLAMAMRHVKDTPVAPGRRVPTVPPALDAVTLKLLAKHPLNRYQSADELRADLRRFREGRPVEATPILAAAAATTAMAGAPTTEALPPPRRTPTTVLPAGLARKPPPKRRSWVGPAVFITILALLAVGFILLARSLTSNNDGNLTTVPNVEGLKVDVAQARLADNGFQSTIEPQQSDTVAKDIVIDYDPKQAADGATITLIVSTGPTPPAKVSVPSVLCLPSDVATSQLTDLNLNVDLGADEPSDNPDCVPGDVSRTEPGEGIEVDEGSTVTLHLVPPLEPPPAPSAPDLAPGSDSGSSNGDGITNSTSLTFTGTADPASTIRLFRDGAEVGTGTADANGNWSVTDSGVDDGTFDYTAVAENDAGPSPRSGATEVTVDTDAPSVQITDQPSDPTEETSATFQFEASESGVSFACQLDGGAFQACSPGQTYDGLAPGSHTFAVRATDTAGNTGSTESFSWTITSASPSPTDTPSA